VHGMNRLWEPDIQGKSMFPSPRRTAKVRLKQEHGIVVDDKTQTHIIDNERMPVLAIVEMAAVG
jgi:hypothetical protein